MTVDPVVLSLIILWILTICVIFGFFALARQVGILYERIAPMGALMMDEGPSVGEQSPHFNLATLDGGRIDIGQPSAKADLLFFLSPNCPVCKKLIPVLRSIRKAEANRLNVVLASDGDPEKQKAFYRNTRLDDFPYVLSSDLGMAFKVGKLPYALLLDENGVIRAKGLVNNREQLESLFTAQELEVESIQDYLGKSS